MDTSVFSPLIEGLHSGQIVPYLGSGILSDVSNLETGQPMPADSDSLIIAMNQGKPMAPKLMWEFPRAAMNVELKKGRGAVTRFLDELYGKQKWSRAAVHDWLAQFLPQYVIDINRDTQLQETYAGRLHTLVRGISRVGGTDFRFRIHHYDGAEYREIPQEEVDPVLPVLFKPMGSPWPGDATYIASDADYVDYITELMGGFAIPYFLKMYRKNKQYLFMGLRMLRDTERMVLSDIIYSSADPAGWALIAQPTDKERRFCEKKNIRIIEADVSDLLSAAGNMPDGVKEDERLQNIGC